MSWSRAILAPLLVVLAPLVAAQQQDRGLRVGHWVTVKGVLEDDDSFVADEVTAGPPTDQHELHGDVTEVDQAGQRLWVLGQPIEISDKTEWKGTTLQHVEGERVKVEGYYRGPRKFSSRLVETRSKGRDRIVGRIDRIQELGDGALELRLLRYDVRVPADAKIESEDGELAELELAPEIEFGSDALDILDARDDDEVPQSIQITDALSAGFQIELAVHDEDNYDLDDALKGDRLDIDPSLRADFLYDPEGNFSAYFGVRQNWRIRDDEATGLEHFRSSRLAEAYGLWHDVAPGWDVQLGRQDFDDWREWLYDENLDALRLRWYGRDLRLELSASTVISDGSPREEETESFMAYFSNADPDKHWAAYLIDRRTQLDVKNYPLFLGVRALGEWFPDHDIWAELSYVTGYEGTDDIRGVGFDLGTTWSPDALGPWYVSAGVAYGSGDDDPTDGEDSAFRQTGLQDNNAKFGGVTSFKYYGELLEPELSNLWISTLGIGRRFGKSHSLDLVLHTYEQATAADRLRKSNLDRRPDGVHRDLGTEVDLIWGSRWLKAWSLEVVLAAFDPGAAFTDGDLATYGKVQLRYRF